MLRPLRSRAVAFALATATALLFWLPALPAGRGWFPAPLDDVYIHFDFARALASGHPFAWIPGQGYSSGETAPLYAVVLGLGHLVGFHGRLLGLWAALVAVLATASLVGSVRRLAGPPSWTSWLVAVVPLGIAIVDWTLFSGMEVALFAALLGRALVALRERGARHERALGGWCALLVLVRPEAALLTAILGVVAAHGVGRRSAIATLLRVGWPAAVATLVVAGANRIFTGDARSAGAQLKLLSSNPYLSDEDRARILVENLVTFWVKVVRGELAIVPLVLPLLVACALARRETRRVATACVLGALGWGLLVSWNGNAPYHDFRYYAPALLLFAIAVALGTTAFGRARGLVALAVIALLAPRFPAQIRFFGAATANIREQHVELAGRIGRLPTGARVLLGDAGVIPYVSGRAAIDALGLGGYRTMPFAHAAVHGEAAVLELLERLAPGERPTHLALYPNWFAGISRRFGREIDRVTITNNVIAGGTAKVLYAADWSPFAPPEDTGEELDVADVIAEEAHRYAPPLPHGGWTSFEILTDEHGVRRFDGGRAIPDGASESFTILRPHANARLRMRIDDAAKAILVTATHGSAELTLTPPSADHWREASAGVGALAPGDVVTLTARGAQYRDFHVWLED